MSARTTWALSVLIWGATTTLAHADAMQPLGYWSAWVAAAKARLASGPGPDSPPYGGGQPAGVFRFVATTPTVTPLALPSAPAPAASAAPADAFLNFGSGNFPEQGSLTTGNAQPWYNSPTVQKVFGGTPTPAQQDDFINGVRNDVQQTFAQSGLTGSNSVSLTTDPNVAARHTMSVVSGTSYGPNAGAIGITDVGNNGFSFIDKLDYATNPTDLEWAVAHNMSHELMHAFGVAAHDDQTGDYLDAPSANWSLLIDPMATLSQAAVDDILKNNIGRNNDPSRTLSGEMIDGAQELLTPVPEPATVVLWGLAVTALIVHHRRRCV
jgi:hypothetical protein